MYKLGCGLVFLDAPGPVVVTSTTLQTPWRAAGEPLLDCANSGTLTNATIRTNERFMTLPPCRVLNPDADFQCRIAQGRTSAIPTIITAAPSARRARGL